MSMLRERIVPCCSGCGKQPHTEYYPELWPELMFCWECIYYVRQWLVSQDVHDFNPFFMELCDSDEDWHTEYDGIESVRVWVPTDYSASARAQVYVKRIPKNIYK